MERAADDYPWEERYRHVFETYCALWNSALNYIAKKGGLEALDDYLRGAMGKDVLGRSAFPALGAHVDAETFLAHYLPHHLMIGGEARVVKAGPDEIVVDLLRCGSKSFLAESCGDGARHYCRHCEVIPLWEQLGWLSETDTSAAARVNEQNIGCRRIFKRMPAAQSQP